MVFTWRNRAAWSTFYSQRRSSQPHKTDATVRKFWLFQNSIWITENVWKYRFGLYHNKIMLEFLSLTFFSVVKVKAWRLIHQNDVIARINLYFYCFGTICFRVKKHRFIRFWLILLFLIWNLVYYCWTLLFKTIFCLKSAVRKFFRRKLVYLKISKTFVIQLFEFCNLCSCHSFVSFSLQNPLIWNWMNILCSVLSH